MDVLKRLFASRKFVTALGDGLAVILVTLLGPRLGLTDEQAAQLSVILVTLGAAVILGIAAEDAAEKSGTLVVEAPIEDDEEGE